MVSFLETIAECHEIRLRVDERFLCKMEMKMKISSTYLHISSDCRLLSTSESIFFLKYSSLWLIMSKHWLNVVKILCVVARNVNDSPYKTRKTEHTNSSKQHIPNIRSLFSCLFSFPLFGRNIDCLIFSRCSLLNRRNSCQSAIQYVNYHSFSHSMHHGNCKCDNTINIHINIGFHSVFFSSTLSSANGKIRIVTVVV